MVDPIDPHAESSAIYTYFGLDPRDSRSAGRLVDACFEEGIARYVTAGVASCDAYLQRTLWGHWEICVRTGLPRRRVIERVLHEVTEWWLHEAGYRGEDIDLLADAIAAAMLLQAAPGRAPRTRLRSSSSKTQHSGAAELFRIVRHGLPSPQRV